MEPAVTFGADAPVATAMVAMQFHLFANIFTSVDQPMLGAVNTMIGALLGYIMPVLKAFVVVWLAGMAIIMAIAPEQFPLSQLIRNLARAAIVFMVLASAATFNQFVGTVFLTTLPTEIGNAIAGTIGGDVVTGGAFDALWNKAFAAGLAVYRDLPSMSIKGAILAFVVFVYWIVAVGAIAISFFIYLASHVLTALLVAVGPLFVGCFIFPATRNLWGGWLSAIVSVVLAQVLIIALLSMTIRVSNTALVQMIAQPEGGNEIGGLLGLLGIGTLLFICGYLSKQVPSITVGIAGGVYHRHEAYTAALANAASAALRAGRSAGRSINNVTTTRSSMSVNRTAGQSLSGAAP